MENRTFSKDFWIYLSIFIAIIILICFFPSLFTEPGRLDFKDKGEIGDTIGGTMGPFVAIAAAILTFLAFWVQYKANEQQRRDIALERFESNLFELIHIQHDITNNLVLDIKTNFLCIKGLSSHTEKGRDVFQLIYEDTPLDNNIKGIKGLTSKTNWEAEYIKCKHIGFLDHYFRHLYRVIKFINDSDKLDNAEKYKYTSIVRASLSQYELIMLFYNCLSKNGNGNFKPLIEDYAIFNNLRTELLATKDNQDLYSSKFKPEYTFEQDENRNMDLEYKKGAFVYKKAD